MRGPDGVNGRLVSRQFLNEMWRDFAGRLGEASRDAALRQLGRWRRRVDGALGPASGVAAIHDVAVRELFALLGFTLAPAAGGSDVVVSVASARRTGPIPVVIGGWSQRLDGLTRRAVQEAAARGARWTFATTGHALRLIDADRPYARQHLDVELVRVAPEDAAGRVAWALARAGAFERRATGDPLITEIVAAADAHSGRVAGSLQQGVRTALESLAHGLARGRRTRPERAAAIVDQSLTIVYRLLFLLFAEARALVPMWNPVYRHSYSIDGLRTACDRPPEALGLWEALLAISRLAHAGCASRDLRVTAFNSQLFAPEHAPLVEQAHVGDETLSGVLRALTDGPGTGEPTRIAYGDLGVEQLGSIYERLLDVTPDLEAAIAAGAAPRPDAANGPAATRTSARRKESGTFYTPRSMAEYLVRETLGPLVRDRSADQILRLRVLDPAMGSGAFLVAACRFLADACADAQARTGNTSGETSGESANLAAPDDRAKLRRLVAQRCLYGVDTSPAAVQLARLSLWLATLAADAPLTFLDHHLCVGDSLVGASIDDLLRGWPEPPRRRARPDEGERSLFDADAVAGLMHDTLPIRVQLSGPDDTPAGVRAKEQALARSLTEGALAKWMALGDLWCARWFQTGSAQAPPITAWRALVDHVLRGASALPAHVAEAALARARATAHERRFLHWRLRFPEVFFAADGAPRPDAGFDAIIGNPPWDMVRGDARDAAMNAAARPLAGALARFVRDSRRYRSGRDAHLNRYQLFTERALELLRPGGRMGLVAPWGLASDVASAALRRTLFERCDTETLIGFENTGRLFPIHRSVRFALVVSTAGRPTARIACRLGQRTLDAIEGRPGASPSLLLTPAWLTRVSGAGMEAPWVRDARDVALLDRVHARCPALGSPEGWGVSFGRELNATDDRALFVEGGGGMPVVDGRHLTPFAAHVDWSTRAVAMGRVPALLRQLPGAARPRIAYRDVASPTNRVTLIAAVLPARVVSTHTVFCSKSALDGDAQYVLCALMNSLVANYLVRLRVTTHVTTALVGRLPMPRPLRDGPAFALLATGARALEQLARETTPLSRSLGAAAFERSAWWARVQVCAAREYGLSRDDLEHVLSTFPLVDPSARRAVIEGFDHT
jgi:N-6 DNA Methylase